VSIAAFNWYPWSTLHRPSINTPINNLIWFSIDPRYLWSTPRLILDRHLINILVQSQRIIFADMPPSSNQYMSRLTLSWLSTHCRVSIKTLIECWLCVGWLSINMPINTRLQMPLSAHNPAINDLSYLVPNSYRKSFDPGCLCIPCSGIGTGHVVIVLQLLLEYHYYS